MSFFHIFTAAAFLYSKAAAFVKLMVVFCTLAFSIRAGSTQILENNKPNL